MEGRSGVKNRKVEDVPSSTQACVGHVSANSTEDELMAGVWKVGFHIIVKSRGQKQVVIPSFKWTIA